MSKIPNMKTTENKIGDFYWAYSDILRGIGINESMYDQRIMAFMALKLLVDNDKVIFDFDWRNDFNLGAISQNYKGINTKDTFLNIIDDLKNLGSENLKYFIQDEELNPENESTNILYYLNHKKTFPLRQYIEELPNNYLEMVLDIYTTKAYFKDYPKEKYKDLYESTISRMKKLSGDLTGQHFTQKSIIHLMCENVVEDLKKSSNDVLAIYDPTCGTGSMLMESAYYFDERINYTPKGRRKKKAKEVHVYGQEMHGQTWLLCKIFLEVCDIPNKIAYGNTLTNPAFDKINGNDSFDFIIANPPFGVDWKHDFTNVSNNMSLGKKSNFLLIKDEKGNIVTPKKSDGQFLFMMHILKLLDVSKKNGKHAKAAVISSTGLVTSGKETSAEGIIRKNIFSDGWVDALIEQPKNMFTNTDISTLIWFLDNKNKERRQQKAYIIKVDNSYVNNHFKGKELKVLYSTAENRKDKQKNGYCSRNIETIIALMRYKTNFPLFGKVKTFEDKYTINFENEMSYDINTTEIDKISKFDISDSYQALSLALMFGDRVSKKYSNFQELIKKLSSYIDGTYVNSFFDNYFKIYFHIMDMIIKNDQTAKKTFERHIIEQKTMERDEINYIFDAIKEINSNISINLDI